MKYHFEYGRSSKMLPGDVADKFSLAAGQTPRFGYWWWEWLPKIDGYGSLFTGEGIAVTFTWLCYWAHLAAWPE